MPLDPSIDAALDVGHTPGPWHRGDSRLLERESYLVYASDKHPVALCAMKHRKWDGSADANLRLICAAPDLLAAAKAFVEQYEQFSDSELQLRRAVIFGNDAHSKADAVLAFRAAIRKAEPPREIISANDEGPLT